MPKWFLNNFKPALRCNRHSLYRAPSFLFIRPACFDNIRENVVDQTFIPASPRMYRAVHYARQGHFLAAQWRSCRCWARLHWNHLGIGIEKKGKKYLIFFWNTHRSFRNLWWPLAAPFAGQKQLLPECPRKLSGPLRLAPRCSVLHLLLWKFRNRKKDNNEEHNLNITWNLIEPKFVVNRVAFLFRVDWGSL